MFSGLRCRVMVEWRSGVDGWVVACECPRLNSDGYARRRLAHDATCWSVEATNLGFEIADLSFCGETFNNGLEHNKGIESQVNFGKYHHISAHA